MDIFVGEEYVVILVSYKKIEGRLCRKTLSFRVGETVPLGTLTAPITDPLQLLGTPVWAVKLTPKQARTVAAAKKAIALRQDIEREGRELGKKLGIPA